jgi:hypothetical protein
VLRIGFIAAKQRYNRNAQVRRRKHAVMGGAISAATDGWASIGSVSEQGRRDSLACSATKTSLQANPWVALERIYPEPNLRILDAQGCRFRRSLRCSAIPNRAAMPEPASGGTACHHDRLIAQRRKLAISDAGYRRIAPERREGRHAARLREVLGFAGFSSRKVFAGTGLAPGPGWV